MSVLYTDLKSPSYASYNIEAINNSIRNKEIKEESKINEESEIVEE